MTETKYKNWLLIVLALILAFNNVDRLVLGLVLQQVKVDLSLTDTQLGFLTGIAFAIFYSVMGIPIARWADRGNRVMIISVTTMVWSAGVALCGLAGTFLQLLLIRVGVAVGEAGCIPPAHSLIADYFTRAERARAVARYMFGGALSVVIGYFVAGWLNEFYGWRATFIILGLPGLPLSVLAWFTLKEPRRTKILSDELISLTPVVALAAESLSLPQPGLSEVWVTLWANRTFRHMLLALAVAAFFGSGIVQWQPAFFIRSYGLQTGEIGSWFTLIYGLGGLVGLYLGGELASRYAANQECLQLKVMACLEVGFGTISGCIYLSSSKYLAFVLMGMAAVGVNTVVGPMFAIIQTLVPDRMRAVAFALIYLFANLVGMGLGPLTAGSLSDALRPWAGEESLRYALLTLCPGYLWVAWHFWRASVSVARDLEFVHADLGDKLEEAPLAPISLNQ